MSQNEVVIQHIVMPSGIVEEDIPLYNRSSDGRHFPIDLRKGETLDLRSHFNLLPIRKLRENTETGTIFLRLHFKGSVSVLVTTYGPGTETSEDAIIPSDGKCCIIDGSEGDLLGIVITAMTDSVLESGEFLCRPQSRKDVHLAHVICTYRREKELRDKLERIGSFLDKDPDMKEHLGIFIIDNGRTVKDIEKGNVRLIGSPNYGGSAGFARGMMEACRDGKTTHVLLNDDDARLDPEILFRTISFYSLLKDGLSDTMLGGTMLLLDRPCETHESGAVFKGSKPHSLKRHLDLSDISSNEELEREESIDYFGWWYLAIPAETIKKNGYPLPMFYKMDDVEYGLRSPSRKVTMCGISVWHPSFSSSYSASSTYYAHRNDLVLLACNHILDRRNIDEFMERALLDTACLRYPSTSATMKAIEDFLKGPDTLFRMCLDGPAGIEGYEYGDVGELSIGLRPGKETRAGFGFRKYTLNGLLLPSSGDIITDFDNMQTKDFYCVDKALYVVDEKKGTLCKRSLTKAIFQTIGLHILKRKLIRNMERLNEEYGRASAHYSSEENWKELFGEK